MKFAIFDNSKIEPVKGQKGYCPVCDAELVAKCGEKKNHHWAHKGTRNCDSWWENETEWHREWKNNFSIDWQEIILTDEITSEKHIADIRTEHGLVIEFQHSHIDPNERTAREKFYKNMIWVVDGTRLKRDYSRFIKGKEDFHLTKKPGIFSVNFPDECLPSSWLNSSVPVIFDFLGNETTPEPNDLRKPLYCLFPQKIGISSIIVEISRSAFVNKIMSGEWSERIKRFMDLLIQEGRDRQRQLELERQQRQNMIFQNLMGLKQYRRSRRF